MFKGAALEKCLPPGIDFILYLYQIFLGSSEVINYPNTGSIEGNHEGLPLHKCNIIYAQVLNIHVYALKNGKGYVADAYIYDMNKKQLHSSQTHGNDPAKFILLPGKYIVKVKDEWGDGKWFELGTIDVKPNKTAKAQVDIKPR